LLNKPVLATIVLAGSQQLLWHQQYKEKLLANAQKKTQQKGLLSLNFLCQQQQQLNAHFFFQKETTESWFQKQIGSFFFFLFPHLPQKRVPRGKLFWLFF